MAVAADSAFHVTKGILVDLPHAVVDHEQIQFPVIVVIEPAGAYRPHLFAIHLCAREASSSCDIGERTIAVVVEELIRGYVREKNVGASIIVVVPDGDPHAVACPGDSRTLGDVGEGAVVIVAIQAVPVSGRFLLQWRDGCPVYQIDVQPAVAIVVE